MLNDDKKAIVVVGGIWLLWIVCGVLTVNRLMGENLNMKTICQIIIAVLLTLGFLVNLYHDIHGREAVNPRGFKGVVITLVVYALAWLCYWKAGSLSELLPSN